MSIVEEKRALTPEDLLALTKGNEFELVDGELLERNVSVLSSLVELLVANLLLNFTRPLKLGIVLPSSTGLRCFPNDPSKVRRANVSFVRAERFTAEHLHQGFLTIAPDLTVEVLSPHDLATEVGEKVEDYLAAGVALVWVIDPEIQTVVIHRGDGSVAKLHATDNITGETVIPGFSCKVAEFFPPTESD